MGPPGDRPRVFGRGDVFDVGVASVPHAYHGISGVLRSVAEAGLRRHRDPGHWVDIGLRDGAAGRRGSLTKVCEDELLVLWFDRWPKTKLHI